MISAARVHRAPRGAAETGYPIDPGHRGTTAGPEFGAWKHCRGSAACFPEYDRRIPQARMYCRHLTVAGDKAATSPSFYSSARPPPQHSVKRDVDILRLS